ncbi:MAG: hypothetical protein P8Y18_07345 [Candidatus Bathyarchaeota archaeon]
MVTQQELLSVVREIMNNFSYSTGLSSKNTPRRYLWTDAFAVCNFLELYHRTEEETFKQFALNLVDQVHHVLGKHREDDPRKGWISGLSEREGEKHPTKGGLRIGKELNEREIGETLDTRLEWDRDGQYYHYLTKWMRALNRISQITGDLTYNKWAIELAKIAHKTFTYESPFNGMKSMYWKMSIDLSRPLISSMGQHDPLDGFITYNELQAVALTDPRSLVLNAEITDMFNICKGKDWTTDDPLGIGGLLCNVYQVAQLIYNRYWKQNALMIDLLKSSKLGLEAYLKSNPMQLPSVCRLAFREFGLSLGLHAIQKLQKMISEKPDLFNDKHLLSLINSLQDYVPLTQEIEEFWIDPSIRQTNSWTEHIDINMVMLATTLIPDGYLGF